MEDLAEFNRHIVVLIEVVHEYRRRVLSRRLLDVCHESFILEEALVNGVSPDLACRRCRGNPVERGDLDMRAMATDSMLPEAQRAGESGSPLPVLVVGGICGLAWAAALRGLMTQIAGSASEVSWAGTFGWVLLPGVATGVLLAWAEYVRRTGGRRGWRWLALSPLLFASVLLPALFSPGPFLNGGVGGGAIGVPVFGMIGGYALSGRGPLWARIASGAIALSAIPIWALTATSVGGPALALHTPRGAWVAIYYWSLLAVLAMACAIPQRPVAATRSRKHRPTND